MIDPTAMSYIEDKLRSSGSPPIDSPSTSRANEASSLLGTAQSSAALPGVTPPSPPVSPPPPRPTRAPGARFPWRRGALRIRSMWPKWFRDVTAPLQVLLIATLFSAAVASHIEYSFDPPLREPDIKRTDLAQPPGGLRDGRFQVETAHLP